MSAIRLDISGMSRVEEGHGAEELQSGSKDCPGEDRDSKPREVQNVLLRISETRDKATAYDIQVHIILL